MSKVIEFLKVVRKDWPGLPPKLKHLLVALIAIDVTLIIIAVRFAFWEPHR